MEELNYGAMFTGLFVSLVFTAVLYGLGPLIFLAFRKMAISNKKLILFCVLYTVFAWMSWNAILFFGLDEEISNGSAAFIWGFGYYVLLKRVLKNRAENSKQNTPPVQVPIDGRKGLCGTPFVQAVKMPPGVDGYDCISSSPPAQDDSTGVRSAVVSKKTFVVVVIVAVVFCALSTTVGIFLTRDSAYDRGWSDGYDAAKGAYERTISGLQGALADAVSTANGGYSDIDSSPDKPESSFASYTEWKKIYDSGYISLSYKELSAFLEESQGSGSQFLRDKAAAGRARIDREYGPSAYGSSCWRKWSNLTDAGYTSASFEEFSALYE